MNGSSYNHTFPVVHAADLVTRSNRGQPRAQYLGDNCKTKSSHSLVTSFLPFCLTKAQDPVFTVGVDVFTLLSYYCHVTLIGFWFRQVHSSFATFVVAPTLRGLQDIIIEGLQSINLLSKVGLSHLEWKPIR